LDFGIYYYGLASLTKLSITTNLEANNFFHDTTWEIGLPEGPHKVEYMTTS